MKYWQQFLAGLLIGIGGMAYINTMSEFWAPFLFSVGLVAVCVLGAQLYTGRIGYLGPERGSLAAQAADLAGMLVLNFAGAAVAGLAGRTVYSIDISALVDGRAAQGPLRAFLLSFGCGMMVYLAVEGYKRTGSLFMLVWPVAVFILCKFDHCVADLFYFVYAGVLPPIYYFPVIVAGNSLGAIALHRMAAPPPKGPKG